jgi:4a-hydroxytetrahydrobiopterin dehydratase
MPSLTSQETAEALRSLPGWQSAGGEIQRTFEFPDFKTAIAFVNRVAEAAEAANHHPDIDMRYNKVKISLSTHDEGGVTQKDIDLARTISGLAA